MKNGYGLALSLVFLAACAATTEIKPPSTRQVALMSTQSLTSVLKVANTVVAQPWVSKKDALEVAKYGNDATIAHRIADNLLLGNSVCLNGDRPGQVCQTISDCPGAATACFQGSAEPYIRELSISVGLVTQFIKVNEKEPK